MTNIICGVDVGSETLDACLGREGRPQRFAYTPDGIAALVAFCRAHNVTLVVMEATGGYERRLFAQLWTDAIPAAVVNPRAVRRFAEGMGVFEKTDSIDCGIIAWFALTAGILPTPPAPATQQRLAALVTRLRQLTEMKVEQTNQRRLVTEPDALETFDVILPAVAAQTRIVEAKIAEAIAADPLWEKLDKAFREIKGVADRTVARLMAELPEIGVLPGKAIAKLAGLAPIANDSGKHRGNRPIRGGRAGVRSILFVVAGVVCRHDPDFKAFHQRLSAAGKPRKVIRVALAHKLLVRLNAKARDVRNELAAAA